MSCDHVWHRLDDLQTRDGPKTLMQCDHCSWMYADDGTGPEGKIMVGPGRPEDLTDEDRAWLHQLAVREGLIDG